MEGRLLGGRYELRGVLGVGATAEVRDGWDTRLNRAVAVKLLHRSLRSRTDIRQRFEIEARAAAALNHPNIVRVYDVGDHHDMPFIVMERLPGDTLGDQIALGPLSQPRVLEVLGNVLAALATAHDAAILHRDIKPGNILLAGPAGVKLADFGTVKTASSVHTTTGHVLGTLAYLSPARITGEPVSVLDDLYALGVVGYEALAGARPFPQDDIMPLVQAILGGQPPPLGELRPDVDAGLVDVIERAMSQDPERRFRSADDMRAAALSAPGRHCAPRSVGSGPVRRARRPVRRAPRLVGSAAFLGVAAAMAVPFVMTAPPSVPASESTTPPVTQPGPAPIAVTEPPALAEHLAAVEPAAIAVPANTSVAEPFMRREPQAVDDLATAGTGVDTPRRHAGRGGVRETVEISPVGEKAGDAAAKGRDETAKSRNGDRKTKSNDGDRKNGKGNSGNGRPK